jgi:adenylate cyclase
MPVEPALRRRRLRVVVAGAFAGSLLGLGYVLALAPFGAGAVARGLAAGAAIGGGVAALETFGAGTAPGRAVRRLPFGAFVLAKTAAWLAWILAVIAAIRAAAPAEERTGFFLAGDVVYSLAVSFAVVAVMEVNRLLGQGVLWRLVTGRYHRPVVEERAFLVLDLAGSTAMAEKLGDVGYLRLLDRIIADVSEDIAAHGGEIYRYLGDAILVSWPLARAVEGAAILRCVAAVARRMAANRAAYEREFGVAPRGRAALHAGPIAVGEVGELHREITFLGDTLNTAARIEQHCRAIGRRTVISGALLARLAPPAGIRVEPLGAVALPGKAAPIELFALEADAPPARLTPGGAPA